MSLHRQTGIIHYVHHRWPISVTSSSVQKYVCQWNRRFGTFRKRSSYFNVSGTETGIFSLNPMVYQLFGINGCLSTIGYVSIPVPLANWELYEVIYDFFHIKSQFCVMSIFTLLCIHIRFFSQSREPPNIVSEAMPLASISAIWKSRIRPINIIFNILVDNTHPI